MSESDYTQYYTELIMEYAKEPKFRGELNPEDLKLRGGNPVCGDEAIFSIQIGKAGEGSLIKDLRFSGKGCMISRAACEVVCSLAKGKSFSEIDAIAFEVIQEELGGVVQIRYKCVNLALFALKEGIKRYISSGQEAKEFLDIQI